MDQTGCGILGGADPIFDTEPVMENISGRAESRQSSQARLPLTRIAHGGSLLGDGRELAHIVHHGTSYQVPDHPLKFQEPQADRHSISSHPQLAATTPYHVEAAMALQNREDLILSNRMRLQARRIQNLEREL